MEYLADGQEPGGPRDKLCPSEEPNEAMADRGPDGRMVRTSRCRANKPTNRGGVALELNLHDESLVNTPQLLERGYENEVSTRDRLARTGADARIEESGAIGEVCLAIRPYGRYSSVRFGAMS